MNHIKFILGCLVISFIYPGSIVAEFDSKLATMNPNEFIPILLTLGSQINVVTLSDSLDNEAATRQEKHSCLIGELKSHSIISQSSILSYLSAEKVSGNVLEYKSYWLINSISTTCKVSIIDDIAARGDVDIVYEDIPIELISTTIENQTGTIQNNAENGLKLINAHELWEEGYTGSGVLVCNFDSGVQGDPNDQNGHIAIKDRWRGNQPGYQPQWAFFDNTDEATGYPVDYSSTSHGTHTMGTITGLDIQNEDTIGVAFDAEWIAAAIFNGGLILGVEAFQWVTDPDNLESTVWDVPDVVNHSWGAITQNCENYPYKDVYEELIINSELISGIVHIFCVGNEGWIPEPYSQVRMPASITNSPVDVFSVGAVDDNLIIWENSSNGPSECGSPYNKKPEVVAKGVAVRSSISGLFGDDYAEETGTSMATPHVAGAAALLRQIYPNSTPRQVKLALLASSLNHDLGDVGEDNEYGNGLVDVKKARDYLPCVINGNLNVTFDCVVNVLDVVQAVDLIVTGFYNSYEFWAADMNEDDSVDVLDIVALSNLASGNPRLEVIQDGGNNQNLNFISLSRGSSNIISIIMETTEQVHGIQLFIDLEPDFPLVENVLLGEFSEQMDYGWYLNNDQLRIVIYGLDGVGFGPGSGSIIDIAVNNFDRQDMNYEFAISEILVSDNNGNQISTNLLDNNLISQSSLTPDKFSISRCYPNPFNPSIKINYFVPTEKFTEISIYNMMGQKIKTIVSGVQNDGYHTVLWDGTNRDGNEMPSAVYFVRMHSENEFEEYKIILLK